MTIEDIFVWEYRRIIEDVRANEQGASDEEVLEILRGAVVWIEATLAARVILDKVRRP